ncbi:MAG: hypothetical protein M1368_04410, partial [Thaumarchaeota archaeon]|nr:hypothetical protein [Nitrososphaerota archaeon]
AFEINSGVDIKNTPIGFETVDIKEPNKVANDIRLKAQELTGNPYVRTASDYASISRVKFQQ